MKKKGVVPSIKEQKSKWNIRKQRTNPGGKKKLETSRRIPKSILKQVSSGGDRLLKKELNQMKGDIFHHGKGKGGEKIFKNDVDT